MSEDAVVAIVVAAISVSGVICSAWIAARSVKRSVAASLDTGNGHTAGEAIANIETLAKAHTLLLAEHTAAMQALDRRSAGTNDLLVRHINDVEPDADELAAWVRAQMHKDDDGAT